MLIEREWEKSSLENGDEWDDATLILMDINSDIQFGTESFSLSTDVLSISPTDARSSSLSSPNVSLSYPHHIHPSQMRKSLSQPTASCSSHSNFFPMTHHVKLPPSYPDKTLEKITYNPFSFPSLLPMNECFRLPSFKIEEVVCSTGDKTHYPHPCSLSEPHVIFRRYHHMIPSIDMGRSFLGETHSPLTSSCHFPVWRLVCDIGRQVIHNSSAPLSPDSPSPVLRMEEMRWNMPPPPSPSLDGLASSHQALCFGLLPLSPLTSSPNTLASLPSYYRAISRQHCTVMMDFLSLLGSDGSSRYQLHACYVQDHGSPLGTAVNGVRLFPHHRYRLEKGGEPWLTNSTDSEKRNPICVISLNPGTSDSHHKVHLRLWGEGGGDAYSMNTQYGAFKEISHPINSNPASVIGTLESMYDEVFINTTHTLRRNVSAKNPSQSLLPFDHLQEDNLTLPSVYLERSFAASPPPPPRAPRGSRRCSSHSQNPQNPQKRGKELVSSPRLSKRMRSNKKILVSQSYPIEAFPTMSRLSGLAKVDMVEGECIHIVTTGVHLNTGQERRLASLPIIVNPPIETFQHCSFVVVGGEMTRSVKLMVALIHVKAVITHSWLMAILRPEVLKCIQEIFQSDINEEDDHEIKKNGRDSATLFNNTIKAVHHENHESKTFKAVQWILSNVPPTNFILNDPKLLKKIESQNFFSLYTDLLSRPPSLRQGLWRMHRFWLHPSSLPREKPWNDTADILKAAGGEVVMDPSLATVLVLPSEDPSPSLRKELNSFKISSATALVTPEDIFLAVLQQAGNFHTTIRWKPKVQSYASQKKNGIDSSPHSPQLLRFPVSVKS